MTANLNSIQAACALLRWFPRAGPVCCPGVKPLRTADSDDCTWEAPVRLNVDHIDEQGERVTVSSSDPWVVSAVTDVMEAPPTTVSGELMVRFAHGHVFVTGDLVATAPRECERCGEGTALRVETAVDLSYVPAKRASEADSENELHSDELNVGWYYQGRLDLSDTLREALALALPARIVCEDAPACDARTRALLGGDSVPQSPPSFAALQNWTET